MRPAASIHIDPIHARDPANLAADVSALRALAQAAVTVELFTIPLYMVPLYSIQGMHEINASEQKFYKGRRWPGAATTHAPASANERAFNLLFSIFIQEMLHLQLAANLATCMGVTPTFTGTILQSENDGWTCFGPDKTVIPHIIDLRDTTTSAGMLRQPAPAGRAGRGGRRRVKRGPGAALADRLIWLPTAQGLGMVSLIRRKMANPLSRIDGASGLLRGRAGSSATRPGSCRQRCPPPCHPGD
jgi:hypothetical protein